VNVEVCVGVGVGVDDGVDVGVDVTVGVAVDVGVGVKAMHSPPTQPALNTGTQPAVQIPPLGTPHTGKPLTLH